LPLQSRAYCHFDAGSARQLRDLLAAVAVYGFIGIRNFLALHNFVSDASDNPACTKVMF
jgi:hypothetical protein